ncbi:MAG TPA: hypothetical protein DHW71_06285 [Gammaproteobacteria bacterium]|nr:hypothetical protein [Gammaproteobacteria bacterium]
MTEYSFIDGLLDSYNPILFVISIVICIRKALLRQTHKVIRICSMFAVSFGYVYGMFLLDKHVQLWASFGLDYSTHTAFAIAVSMTICSVKQWVEVLMILFCFYVVGMLFMDFHTVEDIVATSVVIAIPLFVAQYFIIQKTRSKNMEEAVSSS